MADYLLTKRYQNHFGLDLKSTDLTRPEQFASEMLNAQYTRTGSIEKRKGYQAHGPDQGGYGLVTYNRLSPTDGSQSQQLLSIRQNIYRFTSTTLTVTYGGADPTAFIAIYFDTAADVYYCDLTIGTTMVLHQSLGVGIDEAVPYTITDLASAINAIGSMTAVVAGDGSVPAAFLQMTRNYDLSASGSPLVAMSGSWTQINTPVSNPLAGSETNVNTTGWENVSTTQAQNCVYFANGYNNTLKYDGQNVYRAGIPPVATLTAALGAAGAITGSNYLYKARYIQYDAAGNLIEGNVISTSNLLSPAAQRMTVTVANTLAASGFNTNCAIVNGAQVSVNTITVDAFHTLKVGDTAYFFDSISAAYVTRSVTAIGGTTVTVAGAAVTVADNAVISNNLRIGIYRSQTSGSTPTLFYTVAEIPNDSFNATQVYDDNSIDSALGLELIEPVTDRSPPPKGKYISVFRNILVIAGDPAFPNTVYYSDVENPEYFPDGVNSFDVDTQTGDSISGISPNNELFVVFKDTSIHVVSGSLAEQTFRVDQLTSDIGLASHASIQEVKGALMFLSDVGVYSMVGGQLPQPIGDKIDPIFDTNASLTSSQIYKTKRAVGFNDRQLERYLLFLPAESTISGLVHPNSNSVVYAYDYNKQAWLKWNNINMAGGMAYAGTTTYFSERRYRSTSGTVVRFLYRFNDLNDAFDYQDNVSPINFEYSSGWEALGEPSVLKRFLRIRIFSLEELPNNNLFLNVKTERNYIKDAAQADFNFDLSSDGYGIAAYDTLTPYGNPAESAAKHRLGQGRIRSLRVRFYNSNEQENVKITGWELEVAAPFRPAFKE